MLFIKYMQQLNDFAHNFTLLFMIDVNLNHLKSIFGRQFFMILIF